LEVCLPVLDRAEILPELLRDGDGSLDVLGVERHAFATSQRQSLMKEGWQLNTLTLEQKFLTRRTNRMTVLISRPLISISAS
jgi:hypothetical protein